MKELTIGSYRMLGVGETIFPRKESNNWLYNTKPTNIKPPKTLYRMNRLYLGIYMYIHTHVCVLNVMNDKEATNKKNEQGGFGGKGEMM